METSDTVAVVEEVPVETQTDAEKEMALHIQGLQQLHEKFDKLDKLEELRTLENLPHITESQKAMASLIEDLKSSHKNLPHIAESQNKMGHMIEGLKEAHDKLERLDKLEELRNLEQLSKIPDVQRKMGTLIENLQDSLQKLEKLDKLNELKNLDKLAHLAQLAGNLPDKKVMMTRYLVSWVLEVVKLLLAGLVVVFLLSRETGREIAVKTLPSLGFGSAGQVNLGLKLMMGETTPEAFQGVLSDVRKRIDSEIETAFSPSGYLPLSRRLELIAQVKSYSFVGGGVDLTKETNDKLTAKLKTLHENAVGRMEFEQSFLKGKPDEDKYREMKILLMQKQYPQLLEKALPNWGRNEAINLAVIEGSIQMYLNDPSTLEQLINTHMPGRGNL